jgi:hypothetical protein
MNANTVILRTQARLFLREPANVFFALLFPALLLLAIGLAIPGMREPITEGALAGSGVRPVDLYMTAVLALAVAIETPEGKAEYVARQRGFAERAAPLRARLVEVCETLLA